MASIFGGTGRREFDSMRLVPLDRDLLREAHRLERDDTIRKISNIERVPLAPGAAALDGGELVACGGLAPSWDGRAEAWALISKHARLRQIVQATRLARGWLDRLQRDAKFARLDIYIRADVRWRKSFARALGLEETALLKQWGPQAMDFVMYERIR